MTSEATARGQAFVAQKLDEARGLGSALGELIEDPDEFVRVLRDGLERLADDAYAAEQQRVAPGSGAVFGVRGPLLAAVARQLREPLRQAPSSTAVWLAERLAGEHERELLLFSHVALRRSLGQDPERSWQLMRRLARRASEWISVDSLAELYALGILYERFRWAELEQLIYSADRWERRLVGSTIARLPYELPRNERPALAGTPALTLIRSLIGDNEPDVQKALSWALRSWLEVDRHGVRELMRAEARRARQDNDGHRAWVLRDALTAPSMERPFALEIRASLESIRRAADAPATSEAAAVARGFAGFEHLSERAVTLQGARQQAGARG